MIMIENKTKAFTLKKPHILKICVFYIPPSSVKFLEEKIWTVIEGIQCQNIFHEIY